MPQRSVATNYTFEQQRSEINLLAADFWSHKATVDGASTTYLKHDGSNDFTGGTLAVPAAFTINSNSGAGTVTISGNLNVTGTTTTVNTTNLDVTDKNITIAKGNTSDATADGAGITIDSGTDITWNFVDANDAWVSSIGVEATTHVKAARGQFTGSTSPTTGSGVEINAPDANTGQIIAYNRGGTPTYNELRVKGTSVGVYTGSTNALVGTFNSTGLTMESGKGITCPGDLDVDGTSYFGANGSITTGADFVLSSNKFRVTGSDTVGLEVQRAGNATIQCTDTTNSTDLQLRANSDGGLVRTATEKPLIFGTFQEERLRIHESNAFVTINSGNAENNSALILSKHADGYAKLEFDVGTSQKAYVELDGSENLVHYGAAGVEQLFYAGGSTALTIDTSKNAIFNGSVEIPARRNSGGTLETGTSDNWFKIGTISTLGGGNRVQITILGTNGYGQDDKTVGHTIINITRDNGSTQGVRGHFYGVGTTDSYAGVTDVVTKPTGTSNQFDVYVKPSGHYSNLGSFVNISTGAATWAGSTTDTGSTTAPTSSTPLQKDWGLLLGGSHKLGITSEGDVSISGDGTVHGVSKLTILPENRTTAFAPEDGDTWHDVVLKQTGDAQTNAVGLAFEISTSGYHKNAGTGIAAVKNGTAGDYGTDLVFITRGQSTAATEKLRITSTAGNVIPGTDNTQDLGSTTKRWANVYTGDLNLCNEGSYNEVDGTSGSWTMQEGNSDLFLINRKSGKKYKFNLTEVS